MNDQLEQATPQKLISMTIQQVMIGFLGLAFSVVVFRSAHFPIDQIVGKLQFVLIAYAIGTILQAIYFKRIGIGTGLFLPPISGAIYVQASILALSLGGVPLLTGMTIFAGFCEFILSFVIRKSRFIFPPEICGLVLLLVGLELGVAGLQAAIKPDYIDNVIILAATLLPILIFSVWGKGYVRHICSLIGVVVGVIVLLIISRAQVPSLPVGQTIPWIHWPPVREIFTTPIHFNWSLGLSFFLVGFAATIRTLGLTIGVQQASNPHWDKPDYSILQRAMRSDGITAMIAGLFGVNGLNISPTSTTMAIAFRYTRISLSFAMSICFIILAFFPRILFYVATAPLSIVGAILLYYAAFIFTGGIRTIGAQSFGIRQIFLVGISFCLAVSTIVIPQAYAQLPPPFNVFGRSPLSIGLIFAVILNLFFYIGARRSGHFILRMTGQPEQQIRKNIYTYGESWSITQDLADNVILIASELAAQINHAGLAESDIVVEVKDDPITFTIVLKYHGTPYKMMPLTKADTKKILDEEMVISGLKTFLRGMLPDKIITAVENGNECSVSVTFNH